MKLVACAFLLIRATRPSPTIRFPHALVERVSVPIDFHDQQEAFRRIKPAAGETKTFAPLAGEGVTGISLPVEGAVQIFADGPS